MSQVAGGGQVKSISPLQNHENTVTYSLISFDPH